MKYSFLCSSISSVVETDFDGQLKIFQEKMAGAVCENLKRVLTTMYELPKLYGCHVHHYITLRFIPQ